MSTRPSFFVLRLGDRDFRPDPRAKFSVGLLNENGLAPEPCFFDEHGAAVAPCSFAVPQPVVEAALRQPSGQGEYVDATGSSVRPF